jgi:hypothetical protein
MRVIDTEVPAWARNVRFSLFALLEERGLVPEGWCVMLCWPYATRPCGMKADLSEWANNYQEPEEGEDN